MQLRNVGEHGVGRPSVGRRSAVGRPSAPHNGFCMEKTALLEKRKAKYKGFDKMPVENFHVVGRPSVGRRSETVLPQVKLPILGS